MEERGTCRVFSVQPAHCTVLMDVKSRPESAPQERRSPVPDSLFQTGPRSRAGSECQIRLSEKQ